MLKAVRAAKYRQASEANREAIAEHLQGAAGLALPSGGERHGPLPPFAGRAPLRLGLSPGGASSTAEPAASIGC
jgi:hypothetical protein